MANRKVDLMANNICEHIILVLSAILSNINLHKEFEHFLPAIQPLFAAGTNGDYQHWIRNVRLTFFKRVISTSEEHRRSFCHYRNSHRCQE